MYIINPSRPLLWSLAPSNTPRIPRIQENKGQVSFTWEIRNIYFVVFSRFLILIYEDENGLLINRELAINTYKLTYIL